MKNITSTSLVGKEFFQSQRVFALAFVSMLNKRGSVYTKERLKEVLEESTFLLFPEVLTAKNLNQTIMNLSNEDVKLR